MTATNKVLFGRGGAGGFVMRVCVFGLFCVFAEARTDAAAAHAVLDDFENIGWGQKWVTMRVEGNAEPEIWSCKAKSHSGSASGMVRVGPGGLLAIHIEQGKDFVENGEKLRLRLPGKVKAVGLWIFGNKSGVQVRAELADAGRRRRVLLLGAVDFEGWRRLEGEVPPDAPQPLELQELVFDGGKAEGAAPAEAPELWLDDLFAETEPADEPLFWTFEKSDMASEPRPFVPFQSGMRLVNLTAEPLELEIMLELQDRYGSPTPVTSQGRLVMRQTERVALEPSAERRLNFEHCFGPGVLHAVATVADARTGTRLGTKEVEFRILDIAQSALSPVEELLAAGHDFCVFDNELSPALLTRCLGPELYVFHGKADLPRMAAWQTEQGLKVSRLQPGVELGLGGMRESWVLLWFASAQGRNTYADAPYDFDAPFLVSLERKPLRMALCPDGGGLRFEFPERVGFAALMPLFGVKPAPLAETLAWEKEVPAAVAAHCRRWNEILKCVPVECRDEFRLDAEADLVEVRQKFRFLEIRDEWGTQPAMFAPVPPMAALAAGAGEFPVEFAPPPVDLGVATGSGPWQGAADSDECLIRIRGMLRYIQEVEDIPEWPDTDKARQALAALPARCGTERNYWTLSAAADKHFNPLAPFLSYLPEPQRREILKGARVNVAYMLNPDNLWFEYDPHRQRSFVLDGINSRRMGWCDGNAWSSALLRQLWTYARHTGDWDFLRERWGFIKALYNVPLSMRIHWGGFAYNAGGGDTFDECLCGSIAFSRMAAFAGDADAWRFGAHVAVRQFLSLYAALKCMPRFVREQELIGNLQGVSRGDNGKYGKIFTDFGDRTGHTQEFDDITFTDFRKGNLGMVSWCFGGLNRPDEAEERFVYDFLRDYAVHWTGGIQNRHCPQWYKAVYEDCGPIPDGLVDGLTGLPLRELRHRYGFMYRPQFERWGRFRDVPPGRIQEMMERFVAANPGHPDANIRPADIVRAGLPRRLKPLWAMGAAQPASESAFRPGLDSFGEFTGSLAFFVHSADYAWPSLSWGNATADHKSLSFGAVTPAPAKFAHCTRRRPLSWTLEAITADYLRFPELAGNEDLKALPPPFRSAILENGLGDIEGHVERFHAQAQTEWLVIGPFDNGGCRGFDRVYEPELLVDLARAYETELTFRPRKYVARWEKRRAVDYKLDFNLYYEHNSESGEYTEGALCYAMLHVFAPEPRNALFCLGSDDGYKLWLNGRLLAANHAHRGSAPDQERIPAYLAKGWNKILVKIGNRDHGSGWNLIFRVAGENLLPLPDLEFSAAPP